MFDLSGLFEMVGCALAVLAISAVVMALAWIFSWSGFVVLCVLGGAAALAIFGMGCVALYAWLQ